MQEGAQRHSLGPQLHGRCAEGIGGLQRMPTLHATMTAPAAADVDPKGAHDRLDGWQLFLILRRDAQAPEGAAARWTRGGQRRLVPLIDVARNGAATTPAVPRTRRAPVWPARSLTVRLRKGRRLAKPGAARGVQLLFQVLGLSLHPIAVALRHPTLALCARQLFAQPLNLFVLVLDQIVAFVTRSLATIGHARVMPYPRKKYKYDFLDLTLSSA
jgi:hypothetical protein